MADETEKTEQAETSEVEAPEIETQDTKDVEVLAEKINPEESTDAEKDLAELTEKKSEEDETKGASESTLTKIKNKLFGKKGDTEETKETKEEKEGEDIPDEFTDTARAAGWSDDEITTFAADYSNDELLDMVGHIGKETKEVKKEVKEEKTDSEEKDADEDSRIAKLEKMVLGLNDRLSKEDETRQQDRKKQLVVQANNFFDDVSKEMEVFGKTDKLRKFPDGSLVPTTPEYKARSQVWDDAVLLHNSGLPFDRALKKAFNAYKGEHLEKTAARKLVKDLKKNEKRLTADRYNKAVEKTYTDETERRADVVREQARKAGAKIE